MPRQDGGRNATRFIALGVCFMSVGVALGAALMDSGGAEAGIALIAVGVLLLLMGVARKRKAAS